MTLVIQPDQEEDPRTVRLAVHYQGHTGMTAEFNPNTPAPITLKTIQRIHDQLNKKVAVSAKSLTDAVAAKGVREEFYKRIATGWTLRQQKKAKGTASQRHAYREAVLRHLIRTIFGWILKEDGKLPPEAFDEAFARREAAGTYHNDILTFLFHERLNKSEGERTPHPAPAIDKALAESRFLNGSLFAVHRDDSLLQLADEDYFGTDPGQPGLYTILNEYDWTASEHTPQSSDQTIDPEVLSNLFENLIAATKFGEEVPDKMPAGTYYTPSDIALEMVKDALSAAVKEQAPQGWTRKDLLELFGDEDAPVPDFISASERQRLIARIRGLTVYDPSVGSGEFPFVSALAIKCALRKLGVVEDNAELTRDIISRQIFAQDINPMAVQVTRLRLFVAIIAAESAARLDVQRLPLPNLEGKIICADTLCTVADWNWSPIKSGTLQSTIDEINQSLSQVAAIREQWQSAHDETIKGLLREQDAEARKHLRAVLRGRMANEETVNFASHPLLDPDAPPAKTDPRLLFYDGKRDEFDIVIGNPPYESVNRDLTVEKNATQQERDELKKKRQDRRKWLTQQKMYSTTAGNDLYNLMVEAALALVKRNDGVVTMIVPLSICFGQDQHALRRLFESKCRSIALRNQDIRPDKTFHDSPVEHPANSQRTTIVTAITGAPKPIIELSGANKWRKSERHQYLSSRPISLPKQQGAPVDAKLDSQWERIPTPELRQLTDAMRSAPTKIRDLKLLGDNPFNLAFPLTARYFITAVPLGRLRRGELGFPISDEANFELAMAAANGHAAFAWWKAFGDAFHINPHEVGAIAIPVPWMEDHETRTRARSLGHDLLLAINDANIERITTGTNSSEQDSLNFHKHAPQTVQAIDKLYLESLGLPPNPLLGQLHDLRGDSTWHLGAERY